VLHARIGEVWHLSGQLSDDPLAEFEAATNGLPRTTKAERLTVQRIGQDIFRVRLMTEWGGRCPLTSITDPALLRASHIIPWAECATDAERLDPQNGLLLSALWDAAFDQHLVSFDDDGRPLYSAALSDAARAALATSVGLTLTLGRRERLSKHRQRAGLIQETAL
jgi:predicted restriction endonuclease